MGLFIDDLIEGLIKLMHSNYHLPINIGGNREITIKQLVKIISKLIKSNSKIVYQTLPLDDPTNRKPDITLAKNILDWKPTTNLEIGLQKTIDFLKNN